MTVRCDIATAVSVLELGDRVFLQGACTTPTPLIEALVARGVGHARTVIALVNPQVPRTHGDSFLHISKLDLEHATYTLHLLPRGGTLS